MVKKYDIIPVPKPRMTKRDKWLSPPRPAVSRYWSFKDRVRELGISVPESGSHLTFFLPMPKSWTKKKKALMDGCPHQQTPDKDNLEKALLDAIYDQDCHVWDSRVTKRWSSEPGIDVTIYQF